MSANWHRARSVADAVLYEGYLLYPYRGTSSKNQSRWQWGILGPPGAAKAGIGEDDRLAAQFLVDGAGAITLVVRFLQLQHRSAERDTGARRYQPVDELTTPSGSWLSWDEAVEIELSFGPFDVDDPRGQWSLPVSAPPGTDVEPVPGGRLVRTRARVTAALSVSVQQNDGLHQVTCTLANTGAPATDHSDAIARSLIGTHIIAEAVGGEFVSLLDPPDRAAGAAARCRQHRCFPVLAGVPGNLDLLLISPIILYDYPQVAEQSAGALYDATEIDEILTLRILTLTEDEKRAMCATDDRARALLERTESLAREQLMGLHGTIRGLRPL
jgi:hypothetical protein